MADFVTNVARGKIVYYCELPATNDALILIALKASGIEADDTLKDYDTVAALLAAANDEATNTGYGRKTITSVTVTVDDTNNRTDIDIADQTWEAVQATGGAWGDLLLAYDPDTTGGTDADLIPLAILDFSVTPDGNNIIATINASGILRAA